MKTKNAEKNKQQTDSKDYVAIIRAIGSNDPCVKAIGQNIQGNEQTVDSLEAFLAPEFDRHQLIAGLRSIESKGGGKLVVGRRGQSSRFYWGDTAPVTSVQMAQANSSRPVVRQSNTQFAIEVQVGEVTQRIPVKLNLVTA